MATWYDVAETPASTINIEDFFKTVGEVRSLIEKTSSQADEVEKRHGAILSSSKQDKRNKDELEQLNNETKRTANLVQAKLKFIQQWTIIVQDLKEELCSTSHFLKFWDRIVHGTGFDLQMDRKERPLNSILNRLCQTMQEDFPVNENSVGASVIQRIQQNQHSHLTRWFAEVMRSHHKAQISFREKCKAQIQRQLEIVDKVTTDAELEEMLHRDDLAIFISDINSETQISRQALSEIESRHQDIISLESSIKELHEIFADTAMLLETQGELINNIEKNVTSAAEYVDVSKEETYKAVTYKKNRYKIASLPSFLKPFKRKTTDKTATDQNSSDLNYD